MAISESALLLIELLVRSAISAICNQVRSMTPDEITEAINFEEKHKETLIAALKEH